MRDASVLPMLQHIALRLAALTVRSTGIPLHIIAYGRITGYEIKTNSGRFGFIISG